MYSIDKKSSVPVKWKVLMVDDEPEVHRTARMVLSDYSYKGIGLEIIEACSGEQAKEIMEQHRDIALILLDVVMESDEAGLDFIDYVRNKKKNKIVQIVLKTGQAGRFPEKEVVNSYDINNFYAKTELTADRMTTMVTSALRGYELANSLKKVNKRLEFELHRKKIAEAELKASESRIRKLSELQQNIIDSTDIWLHVKDISNRIILWNKAAETISGYLFSEIEQRSDFWEILIPFDDERKRIFEEESAANSDRSSSKYFETKIVDRFGNEKILNWHIRALRENGKDVTGLSYLGVDVTEKKILEKKFLHTQKMEAVGRLAGGVAHDFNNTLTVIRGYCELLNLKARDNDNLRKNIAQIDIAAEKAEILTRQLLSFSRHQLVKTDIFNINDLVFNMESMLSRLVNENISIRLDLCKGRLPVKSNSDKIEQVLMNLVVNSVDAMPGGGEIIISTRVEKIRSENKIFLSVKDNGTGIPKDIQAKVFDPFFTTKPRDRGTGLGLSTVYGIMKQCGGSVFLKSAENKGTEIILSFPVAKDFTEKKFLEVNNSNCFNNKNHPGRFKKILVVEENSHVRDALCELLELEGYEVLKINPDIRSEYIEDFKDIDVLVTDFIMKGLNGPDLFEKLSVFNPHLKVVYISGSAVSDIPKKSNIHVFLEKPFSSVTLLSALKELRR
ncbi:MAG: response regulator [Desulfobacteraceae bacterium]|nr:response regulator [Desulfobacteraceae bacterium]MCB9494676.1 response regulator [Desulfobacteraceae bacterium]